jgi:hypothetical protein
LLAYLPKNLPEDLEQEEQQKPPPNPPIQMERCGELEQVETLEQVEA